ncbi:MAG: hypothetical protein LBC13_02890, partial [Clostridiales bacterium]|nr:hypothetical protein [Clostridiales bacterium]
MINGNTEGIKKSVLEDLEKLHTSYDKDLFIDRKVLRFICALSTKINREICLLISRAGAVVYIGIGDNISVPVQDISLRRAENRFSGVRCVHTHPNGTGEQSDLDISSLRNMRLDCMCAVGVSYGESRDISVSYSDADGVRTFSYDSVSCLPDAELLSRITEFENRAEVVNKPKKLKKRAVLALATASGTDTKAIFKELEGLAETAGLEVVGEILQIRDKPDNVFCVGRGK